MCIVGGCGSCYIRASVLNRQSDCKADVEVASSLVHVSNCYLGIILLVIGLNVAFIE